MFNLIIIFLALLFSAFFSGMEIAFLTSNKLRIEIEKKHKLFASGIVKVFTNNPARYIATMLVGNNIALVIYGIVIARQLEQPIINLLHTDSAVLVLILQTIISTLLILLTAEFLPKTLFRINPNGALRIFSIPVLIFYVLLYPVSWLSIGISNFTMRYIFKVSMADMGQETVFGKVDLDHLVKESNQEEGTGQSETQDLKIFKNALELSNLKVRDCMIPRTEIVSVDIESPVQVLVDAFTETGLSRILIYRNTIDNVIGYVNSKDMFQNPEHIGNFLKTLPVVPETLPVNKILKSFIKDNKSIAVVVDEFGGTSGLITTEDVIEEIFGEIQDEHDIIDLIEQRINDHTYMLSGRLETGYLNETYQLEIPESEEYDTLAGFIIYHLNNIPGLNETIQIDRLIMKINKVSANRIELVELTVNDES
ncbi:MAG: hemolysin family protein [Bacteroidales bacterium]|nr:hemolysin family protein [Bacteroidales bacterium]